MNVLHKCFVKNEKRLFAFFIFSLVFCFLQTVLLADTPEFFIGGARAGTFISAVCYSYIASYIFYYVALKVDRDNKRIYHSYAIKKALILVNIFESNLKTMSKQTSLPFATDSEIKILLNNINIHDNAIPYVTYNFNTNKFENRHYSWAEYIVENNVKMKNIYSQILPLITSLDVDLVDAIYEIIDSSFFTVCDLLLANGLHKIISNRNLSFLEKEFIEMTIKVKTLKILLCDIKKLYKIN